MTRRYFCNLIEGARKTIEIRTVNKEYHRFYRKNMQWHYDTQDEPLGFDSRTIVGDFFELLSFPVCEIRVDGIVVYRE